MKAWFMFDRHTFRPIDLSDRAGIIEQVIEAFAEDGCGSLFVRDDDDTEIKALCLEGRRLGNGQWGVPRQDISDWADAVLAEKSFRLLMA